MVNSIAFILNLIRFAKNNSMRRLLFLLLIVLSSISANAQFDKKGQSVNLQLKSKTPFTPDNNSPSIDFKSSLETKEESYLKKYSVLNKKEPVKSVLEQKSDFKNPGDEIKEKLNKEIAKSGNWEDVFFGKFIVYTPIIKLSTRDYIEPDDDRVSVILNDIVYFKSITLEAQFKTFTIDLREGDNILQILALNQGLVGPNTAAFTIYDGNDNLITTNNWTLFTGVSAKFIIEYRKKINSTK